MLIEACCVLVKYKVSQLRKLPDVASSEKQNAPLIPFICMALAYDFFLFLTLVFLYLIPLIDLQVLFIFAFFKTAYLCHILCKILYRIGCSLFSKMPSAFRNLCSRILPSNSYLCSRILSYACPQIHTCTIEYCRMRALKYIIVPSNIVTFEPSNSC